MNRYLKLAFIKGLILSLLSLLLLNSSWNTFSDEEFQLGFLFISGLVWSILWIHLLFPVPFLHYWHLHKRSALIKYLLKALLPYLITYTVLVVFFGVKGSLLPVFWGLPPLFLLLNTFVFLGIGNQSQAWRTGKRGNAVRRLAQETGSISVPLGSIPGLLRTLVSAISSVLLTVLLLSKSFYFWIGFYLILLVGFLFIFYRKDEKWGFKTFFRSLFLSDNAFFDEYFLVQDTAEALKPVPRESLFWVPSRLKSSVRFLLTQHFRIRSTSRILISVHLTTWFFLLIEPQWLTRQIIFSVLIISLLIEVHVFFSKSMGAFGLHQLNNILRWFNLHFFSTVRWLPINSLTLYFLTGWTWKSILIILVFIGFNSVIQAFIQYQTTKSIYG